MELEPKPRVATALESLESLEPPIRSDHHVGLNLGYRSARISWKNRHTDWTLIGTLRPWPTADLGEAA